MIRDALTKITKTIAEFRASSRTQYQVPAKVWLEAEKNGLNFKSPNVGLFLLGRTSDLSSTGISFYVPSIRIKEDYLVGQNRTLNVELELAGRKVRMQVVGRRYEQIPSETSEIKYLVGAEISEMSEEERRTYEHFLRNGRKIMKGMAASMEFGLD